MKLIDYILKTKKNWTFQIFQNVLSLCGMIPLRLYDFNQVHDIYKRFYENMGEVDIDELGKDPIKAWPELSIHDEELQDPTKLRLDNPWLTRPSYPLPLWVEAMSSDKLRSCKSAFVYHWLKRLRKEGKERDLRLIIMDFLIIGCIKLNLPDKELYLITGPVLRSSAKNQTGEELYDKVIKPLIDYFASWMWPSKDDISKSEWARQMDIMGSLRPSLDEEKLENRFERAAKSLENLLLAIWPEEEILRRCMCRDLARKSWILCSTAMNETLGKLKRENPGKIFSLDHLKLNFQISANKPCLLEATFTGRQWNLNILPISNEEKIGKPGIELIKDLKKGKYHSGNLYSFNKVLNLFRKWIKKENQKNFSLEEANKEFDYFCHWIEKRIVSMEIAYNQERLIVLEQWFRREFGLLAANMEEIEPFKTIFMRICSEIAQLLIADQCDIYRCSTDAESLELVGCYPQRKHVDPTRDRIFDIGFNKEKRRQSILYRTIDDDSPHFCRAVIKKNGNYIFVPKDEGIIVDPEFPVSSVISVPLKVNGRIFGVLEVSGFSPYQFMWENRQLLRRISEVISPLIYETFLFHSLADLTHTVLNTLVNEKIKYQKICEKMRELFMAYAAVFWHPDRERSNRYVPVGWSRNRADLKDLIEQKDKSVFFKIDDPTCLYNLAVEKNKGNPPLTLNIEDKLNDEEWYKKKPHREWLRKKKIKEVTIISITSETDGDKLILTLYYRHKDQGLEKSWNSIIEFMAYHSALLLEALMSQKKWETGVRHILHHELKQKVGVILSRTDDIYQFLWQKAPKVLSDLYIGVRGARSKLNLVFQDIRSYSFSLNELMDILQNPATFEKLKRTPKYPLHFIAITQKKDYEQLKEKKQPVDLKKMFNEVFMNTWEIRKKNNLAHSYHGPEGPLLLMVKDHLRPILNNLIDNAVKYAVPETSIAAKTTISEYSVEFRLSNFSKPIGDYEEYSIFNENVRGSNSENMPGQGQGLFLARLYCEIYGGELTLQIERKTPHPLFTFVVSLPKQILFKKNEEEV
jgi:signal transduction histidine kinase